jgi:FMN phosphatase YigB (HAD superfamily)
MAFTNVRNIILDFGGVIIDIDYKRTEQAFIVLGMFDFPERYSQLQQTTLFDDFETGKISSDTFISTLKTWLPDTVQPQQIIAAWNAMLLDIPLRRLQILQQLQLHFNTFLLSNTNAIHEEAFNKILKTQCGFKGMGVFFDKVYYSHHVGMRKPNADIFEFLLQENDLKPAQTLFIDDSPQHIATAEQLGLQTIWLTGGMTIEKDIFKPKAV